MNTTMSDLDAMLRQIEQANYMLWMQLFGLYNTALYIDTQYQTDITPGIAAAIERIASTLPALYRPEF